jgi:TP901 family phage tail tape measure protein
MGWLSGAIQQVFDVQARIKIDTDAMKKLPAIQKAIQAVKGQFKATGKVIGKSLDILKRFVGPIGLGAIAAGTYKAVSAFASFENGLLKVQTLLGDGQKALPMFGEQVKEFAIAYGKSIGDVNNALFDAVSAGVKTDEAFAFLTAAGKASAGGFTDLKTSVGGAVSVLNAYNMKIEDTTKVYDAMFAANVKGITTFEELSVSVGQVASFAAQAGVGYQELFGAFAGITKITKNTQTAATGMRSLFAAIIKPSGDAAGLAEILGVDMSVGGIQKAGGIQKFLADAMSKAKGKAGKKETITKKVKGKGGKTKTKTAEIELGDTANIMATLFGSIEAFNVAAVLSSESAQQGMTEAMDLMKKGGSLMEKSFGDASGGVQFKLSQLKSAFDVFLVEIGGAIVDEFGTDGKELAAKLMAWMKDAKKYLKSFMATIRDVAELIGKVVPHIGTIFTMYIGGTMSSDLFKFGNHLKDIAPGMESAFGQKMASKAGGLASSIGLITVALTGVYTIAQTIATLIDQQQEKEFAQKRTKSAIEGSLEAGRVSAKVHGIGSKADFVADYMKENEDKYKKEVWTATPNDILQGITLGLYGEKTGLEIQENEKMFNEVQQEAYKAWDKIVEAKSREKTKVQSFQPINLFTNISVTGENVKIGDAKTEYNTGKTKGSKLAVTGGAAVGAMAGRR